WLIAGTLDLKTTFEVTAWNGRIQWTVGTTTISARAEIVDVDSIAVTARAGMFPMGGGLLEATTPDGSVRQWRLPGKFSFPRGPTHPVGDWWVDETAAVATVFSTSADLGPEFTLRGTITGRHHQHLILMLGGAPDISFAFRRGLLNNDLLIFDDLGGALASGSLDPQPLHRLGATAATVLRAIAGGALLLALWSIIPQFAGKKSGGVPQVRTALFVTALGLLALIGAGLAAWTAVDVFDNLPHLPDEIVYQLQGRWLLSGHLTGSEPLCSENFAVPLTYIRSARWIGHYPPAWPLVLAPGIAVGAPWLAPALLRIPHILLIALLALRLGGRWTALAAAAAALASPLALLLFGSRMPHAGSATLLLGALLLCLPRDPAGDPRTPALRWMVAGIAFGLAFGMRPLTAVAVAIPIGLFHLGETLAGRRRWRDGIWLVFGGLTASLPTLSANDAIMGSPWTFPYALAEGSMYSLRHAAFGIRNLDTLLASLGPLVHGWGWPWLGGPISMALPFAFVTVLFLSRGSTREDRLLAAVAAAVVLAHLGTRATGLHGFGPRYLFVPCAITWVLTARGAGILAAKEDRTWPVAAVLLGLLTFSAAAAIPARLPLYRGYNDVTTDMTEAAAVLPECSLVLFPEDNWRGWAEASPWLGRDPDDDHTAPLFAADLGEALGLEWCYPDRRIYRWTGDQLIPAFDDDDHIP
ncbi:MAG: hypothetical protein ABFS37_14235, partial [Acidobacteriota bacterium]